MVKHRAQEGDPLPNICLSLLQDRKIACLSRGISASLLLLLPLLPSTLDQCSPSQIVPAPCSPLAEPLPAACDCQASSVSVGPQRKTSNSRACGRLPLRGGPYLVSV